jgi:hypothetical protein
MDYGQFVAHGACELLRYIKALISASMDETGTATSASYHMWDAILMPRSGPWLDASLSESLS